MARWVPFLALTASVLSLLLGLARLSTAVVRDDDSSPLAGDSSNVSTGQRQPPDDPAGTRGTVRSPERAPDERPPSNVQATEPSDGVGQDGTREVPTGRPVEDSQQATEMATPATDAAEPAVPRTDISPGRLLTNVALTQGLFGAVLVGGFVVFDIPASAIGVTGDPWSVGVPALVVGLVFGALLWAANETVATIADAVGAGYDEKMRQMLAPETPGGWIVLLVLVLPIIAFVEEFIFRAAVIGVTAAGSGVSPWILAALSSVAFALGHGAQGRVGIVVTGGLGFVLAAGFVVSGSLLVVVVAHYVVNALEFLVHEGLGAERLAV